MKMNNHMAGKQWNMELKTYSNKNSGHSGMKLF